jgi:cytochrome c oxidase assembly protein subunit 15
VILRPAEEGLAWLCRGSRSYPLAVLERLRGPVSPETYRKVTAVALGLLALIVVTGAAVRLTGSGLGCTDWPSCSEKHFVASRNINAQIEFGNRLLTGVVSVAVVAAVLASLRRSPRRRDLTLLSWGLVAGVVGQILLGGVVVLSHLNPWLVQAHFVLSMLLVLDAVVLDHRAGRPDGVPVRPVVTPALLAWGRGLVALASLVLITGTLVTGAGPHSGQNRKGEAAKRLPLHPHDAARIHGITVMVFLAVTVWVLVQLRRHQRTGRLVERATVLITLLIVQAGIGYTQYFTGVPPMLVGLHVFGATLVWIASLQLFLSMSAPVEQGTSGPAESSGGHDRSDLVPHGDLVPGR